MNTLIFTILTLCAIGVVAALILYFVAQKFKVEEDPRIDDVEKMLPGANCGGCGFPAVADWLVLWLSRTISRRSTAQLAVPTV